MRVTNVLVEELDYADGQKSARVRSSLYEFESPHWVSTRREGGKQLGPINLLGGYKEDLDLLTELAITAFPERDLHIADGKISFEDTWTIPQGTLYAVVPPKSFLANPIKLDGDVGKFELAANQATDGLFYYATFRELDRDYKIEALFEYNAAECENLKRASEIVEGTKRFEGLRSCVKSAVLSRDFWFKLIEVAGGLMK